VETFPIAPNRLLPILSEVSMPHGADAHAEIAGNEHGAFVGFKESRISGPPESGDTSINFKMSSPRITAPPPISLSNGKLLGYPKKR
jgi:hypothetical protein